MFGASLRERRRRWRSGWLLLHDCTVTRAKSSVVPGWVFVHKTGVQNRASLRCFHWAAVAAVCAGEQAACSLDGGHTLVSLKRCITWHTVGAKGE